jgi:hypothetical protein
MSSAGSASRYSDQLRGGRSGVRILVTAGDFSLSIPSKPAAMSTQPLTYLLLGLFPGVK